MGVVIAVNSKGQRQKFSELAWKLLGKNKGGWTEIGSQTVGNNVTPKEKAPNMGPNKNQKVGNNVTKKEDQTAGNTKGKTEAELFEEAEIAEKARIADEKYNGAKVEKIEPSKEQKQEFNENIKDLTRGAIKDLFDNQKPKVEYNNRANIVDLKQQLAEYCNYDLVKLQEIFE